MKKVRKNGLSGATAIVTPLNFFNVLSNPTLFVYGFFGTPDAIRTHDLQSRSLTLYPTELQAHMENLILRSDFHFLCII